MSQHQINSRDGKLLSASLKALQLARQRGADGLLGGDDGLTLLERFQQRAHKEELQRQQNIEQIMRQCVSFCGDSAGNDPDPDWLSAFIRLAEEIASPKMQRLWSRILAMEIETPGHFSVKTLNTLKNMTHREAQLFQIACSLSSKINDEKGNKLLIGYFKPSAVFSLLKNNHFLRLNPGRFRLPYSGIMTLCDLGLLYSSELESGELIPNEEIVIHYNENNLYLQPKEKHCKLLYYRFTPTGNELATLIPPNANSGYQQAFMELFTSHFQCSHSANTTINQEQKFNHCTDSTFEENPGRETGNRV